MNKSKWTSIALTIGGIALTLASTIVNSKNNDRKMNEAAEKAVEKLIIKKED